ncbi:MULTISPECIES: sensor histidine kinase [Paenibacillus]|uniref:sensor histidine kinase n=1 Tax=Paenibacillus TaxID=44249 RepID=UPI0022B8B502|nr:histidine kinase [Paenibacillus caseinilyticus]MCZ8521157.1 histidine kinase [Paenibacillus caseinilyticus]
MIQGIARMMPSKLSHRVFLAFTVLVLLPMLGLQLYAFQRIENGLFDQVHESGRIQLEQLKSAFETTRGMLIPEVISIEMNYRLMEMIEYPERFDTSERVGTIAEAFEKIQSRSGDNSSFFHLQLADRYGHFYESGERRMGDVDAEQFAFPKEPAPGMQPLLEDSPAGKMLAYYDVLTNAQGEAIGRIKISFLFTSWIYANTRTFLIIQDYYLIDRQGTILTQSGRSDLHSDTVRSLLQAGGSSGVMVDDKLGVLLQSTPIPALDAHLVSGSKLDIYFGNARKIKSQFVSLFLVLALFFVLVTYYILSAATRPLLLLQKKMKDLVHKNFRLHIPPGRYSGEILTLVQAFNGMITDMNQLIQRLKSEERQKESVRFQVLMAQMDPHFLMNTLNTIKWHATSKQDPDTARVCLALGKLLEKSLNVEEDLIHLIKEVELVHAYAEIQNFRFRDKFTVEFEYEPDLDYALVPKLSLQPLVENSIIHGFERMKHGGHIRIRVYQERGKLFMEVIDNGQGLADEGAPRKKLRTRKGIGLHNLRERLQLLFRHEAYLELRPLPIGCKAVVCQPFLLSKPFSDGAAQVQA